MEWVFVAAVVVVLGAKIGLARSGYRRTRQRDRRRIEAPDHLPGQGTGTTGG